MIFERKYSQNMSGLVGMKKESDLFHENTLTKDTWNLFNSVLITAIFGQGCSKKLRLSPDGEFAAVACGFKIKLRIVTSSVSVVCIQVE